MNLCDVNTIEGLLFRHKAKPIHSLGQNFLIDRGVLSDIVEASGADESCGVLEVGPGIGVLTRELAQTAGRVVSLELDRSLLPVLKETVGEFENAEVINTDALRADLAAIAREKLAPLRPIAAANLPYYITTPILTAFLGCGGYEQGVFMLQKEAAERICAAPGSEHYSAFTVFANWKAEPALLFEVPPDCFYPSPKVTSAVLRLKLRETPPAQVKSEKIFMRTFKAAFALRRKTLKNAISSGFPEIKARAEEAITAAGISPSARGETLSIAQFAALADSIYNIMYERDSD